GRGSGRGGLCGGGSGSRLLGLDALLGEIVALGVIEPVAAGELGARVAERFEAALVVEARDDGGGLGDALDGAVAGIGRGLVRDLDRLERLLPGHAAHDDRLDAPGELALGRRGRLAAVAPAAADDE